MFLTDDEKRMRDGAEGAAVAAAMGAGAAHALDLAGRGSVHDVDLDRLRDRLTANVGGRS